MTTLGGFLLYAGLIGAAAGLLSLVKPLRIVGIRSRRRGLLVFGMAFLVFAAGVYLPIGEMRAQPARTRLDEFAPVFQFYEVHRVSVAAAPERVDAAIRNVTPEEIRYYRTLTWLRRVARPGTHGVLNPPQGKPILDTFTTAFQVLSDEPGREIVLGHADGGRVVAPPGPEAFKAFHADRLVKITFSFRMEEAGPSRCLLTTETRVYAVGTHVLRGFAAYWRMIYPGSALIRSSWLRAIRLRAEATTRWGISEMPHEACEGRPRS